MEPTSTAAGELTSPDQVKLLDPEQIRCPWRSYEVLREQAPVWQDPGTGQFVVSRYEDIRYVHVHPELFVANLSRGEHTHRPEIRELYETEGMLPATPLLGLDDPLHRHVRAVVEKGFRPPRVKAFEPAVEQICHQLIDGFIGRGEVDLADEYSAEVALHVITRWMGVPLQDADQIRSWTEAWLARVSGTMAPEDEIWSCRQEIAAQNYFQPIIDRVRAEPDDTFTSEIVNGVVPEWGEGLPDNQIQVEIFVDMFTGGVHNTAYAITNGILLFIERPDVLAAVREDPERRLPAYVEEMIRLHGPAQGGPRFAAQDTELGGVKIPKGATVHLRWGAGNRDPRRYAKAEEFDLGRARPRSHLGFGTGTHHCIGAPLARREVYFGLKAMIDRMERMWLLDEPTDWTRHDIVRGLHHARIGFEPRAPIG